MRESTSKVERRVPVLGRIPGLGAMFTDLVDTEQRTERMVLLTPTIIDLPATFGSDFPVYEHQQPIHPNQQPIYEEVEPYQHQLGTVSQPPQTQRQAAQVNYATPQATLPAPQAQTANYPPQRQSELASLLPPRQTEPYRPVISRLPPVAPQRYPFEQRRNVASRPGTQTSTRPVFQPGNSQGAQAETIKAPPRYFSSLRESREPW